MNYPLRGKYLDDFKEGEVILTPARTVTEADVSCFAGLTGDYNPLHTSEEFAKDHSMFKTRIAHGLLGLSILSGLLNQTGLMEGTTIAFIESNDKFTGPLRFGDTVMGHVTVKEVKPSSKPGRGILKLYCELRNQNDEVVIVQEQVLMMKRKDD